MFTLNKFDNFTFSDVDNMHAYAFRDTKEILGLEVRK